MRIILATDGSDHALRAAHLLARLPVPPDTLVTILSAVPLYSGLEVPLLTDIADGERAAAQKAVDHAAATLRERGIRLVFEIYQGDPATSILERADAGAADLIVLGSRGRGAVERSFIGSVSEQVARHAHCSVLVVRGGSLRTVVVGIDDSDATEHALDALSALPLPETAEIRLLHVARSEEGSPLPPVEDVDGERMIEACDHERMAAAQRTVRCARACLHAAGRSVTTEIRCGSRAEQLIAGAQEAGADLLVVGSANRSLLGRLFLGSVSARVLQHAPCSVLVARSPVERVRLEMPSAEAVDMRRPSRAPIREPAVSR